MIIINSKKVSTAHTEMRPRRRKRPHKKSSQKIIINSNKKTNKVSTAHTETRPRRRRRRNKNSQPTLIFLSSNEPAKRLKKKGDRGH